MNLQKFSGEVSEVSEVSEDIFQVRNRCDNELRHFSGALSAFDVRNLSARKCGSSTFREPCNLYSKSVLSPVFYDMLRCVSPMVAIGEVSEVKRGYVLGITTPCKPLKTLVFLTIARLARLFPPMLQCTHACVRMRR